MSSEEDRLAQFKTLRRIGAGRFGEVYQVQHKVTGELFCWKVVSYKGLSEKEKEQLVMEVNVMRDLKHPNIVRYVDRVVDRQKHLLYIIMEYCDSGDLGENMRQFHKHYVNVNEQVIFDIALQLLFALAYCHNSSLGPKQGRILHRDLKPQNIFLHSNHKAQNRNGYVCKIGDLGLCRSIGMESFAHSCVGTPYYWCPEILLSQSKNYDDKMDMWALGIVLYELSYGKTPFHKATTLAELAQLMKNGVPLPLPGRSRQLNTLLYALLQQDPSRRASAVQCLGLSIWDGPVYDWFWATVNERDREKIYYNIVRRGNHRLEPISQPSIDFGNPEAPQLRTPVNPRHAAFEQRATTDFMDSESDPVDMDSTPRPDNDAVTTSVSTGLSHLEADIAFYHRAANPVTPKSTELLSQFLPLGEQGMSLGDKDSDAPSSGRRRRQIPPPSDEPVSSLRQRLYAERVSQQYPSTPTKPRYLTRAVKRREEQSLYTHASEDTMSVDSNATTCVRHPDSYRAQFTGRTVPAFGSSTVQQPHTLAKEPEKSNSGSMVCSRRNYMSSNHTPRDF
ncbi:protein kinase domain containing protein [Babesia bovis T2Bo]|uniref:non-specific serine/threonine protein kinase n=1 Tax=Babesia bovis TaxID=5865 RepID=A7APT0_BABBO|nr:protein kinase domain containing protein [Babesia bovis T2Bo]EDO08564.1 protein kinase domain containing protein [Babesia bovis T2Bo]|eukprot:XP_001612132.1 protein kinase domain containing protein [Babesia bovis T2Bo]